MALDHFEDYRSMLKSPWWNFNVLFNNQPAVQQMVADYAKALNHPGLYPPVPPQWLHATILAVGPVGDYSEQEMFTVTEVLKPKLSALKLPDFTFDSWRVSGDAALKIKPDDQFSKIYGLVRQSLEHVVGPDRTRETPGGEFISHVTLAYTRSHYQEHEIQQQLSNNPIQKASFNVDHLSLIKQYRSGGHYEWIVVKELPIGSA